MGLDIDTTANEFAIVADGSVKADGKKINLFKIKLAVTADDQTAFTLPFSYVEGDEIEFYIDNVPYKKDDSFTVTGTSLTWLAIERDIFTDSLVEVRG